MKRDRRLLVAIVLFTGSALACAVQVEILNAFINASVMGDWTHFAETFSVKVPGAEPNKACFDYCAPELPFAAGWISIATFVAGLALVGFAWWKPKT